MARIRDLLNPPEPPDPFTACSQGATAETRLAVLVVPSVQNDKELRNHIHPVDPTFPARFVVGESFKPTSDFEEGEHNIKEALNMKATFVFMDIAPVLRVQLVWNDDFKLVHGPRGTAYVYELALECNGGMVMEGRAKVLASTQALWKSEDRDLYNYAMSVTARDAKRVKMELWQFPADPPKHKKTTEVKPLEEPVANDRMAVIMPHLPGTPESQGEGGFVLPSFDYPPLFAWLNNNGRITVQPGVSKSPFTIMTKQVFAPMVASHSHFPLHDLLSLSSSADLRGIALESLRGRVTASYQKAPGRSTSRFHRWCPSSAIIDAVPAGMATTELLEALCCWISRF
ncbi:hypothetical protein CBER1_10169 [Cercospora berteroae]|uniref:Uncharacterized protein n=1 Tax=Cercospora berteroae TaxID=357750 RepID=A0A2S6BYI2_9PEZI|nr:hypothetical protein CBER1_10169 [Cercospora berteroae]